MAEGHSPEHSNYIVVLTGTQNQVVSPAEMGSGLAHRYREKDCGQENASHAQQGFETENASKREQ